MFINFTPSRHAGRVKPVIASVAKKYLDSQRMSRSAGLPLDIRHSIGVRAACESCRGDETEEEGFLHFLSIEFTARVSCTNSYSFLAPSIP
jgi:hypothetical protein